MKATCYLEILSSLSRWVEPEWAELKSCYGGKGELDWKIALMNPSDFPVSRV